MYRRTGATASKVENFEGLPLSSYTLEIWGKTFQFLKAEAQHTPILLHEDIKRAKGGGVKVEKLVVPLIESVPKELSLIV